MRQIELEPKDYKRRDPDGIFRHRMDRRVQWAVVAAGIAVLGYIWWNMDSISPSHLFWATGLMAIAIGVILADLFRNLY